MPEAHDDYHLPVDFVAAFIVADEQAAQNLINAANASLASGSFNLTVFESSFAAAILTYQHDITAAKVATVPTATPTSN